MADQQQPREPGTGRDGGAGNDGAAATARDGHPGRRLPSRRALRVTAWAAAGVLLLGGGGLAYLYHKLNGNLHGVDIDGQLGRDRPADVDNGSLDVLVLGSDSRAGRNARYGDDAGTSRSDTAMVVHVQKGHRRASIVSIPRDTLVSRPECRRTGRDHGTAPAAERAMFNESYEIGGPACAVKTVEAMTGIRMDHYLEIDFAGFKDLVDALGGVTVTTTEPIHDNESHLDLPKGTHHLDGEQSLGFVRTRHAVGDGSDLGRIRLQQQFLAGLLTQIQHTDVFSSPKRLYDVANATTKVVTTDDDIASMRHLMDLARSMKHIKSRDLDTVTLPVDYDAADPNRVVPKQPQAGQVWAALRGDRPIPPSARHTEPGAAHAGHDVAEPQRPALPRLDPTVH
jgi:LCP family protein required for cell wall assembly